MAKTANAKAKTVKAVPQKQGSGNPSPNPSTRFQPGQSGNPGGKPVNARNSLTKAFLEALAKDFTEHGETAIQDARADDPMGYVRVVASLLPKEFVVERPLDGMSDEELAAAITELRSRLGNDQSATQH
jgi:hypothetical protein